MNHNGSRPRHTYRLYMSVDSGRFEKDADGFYMSPASGTDQRRMSLRTPTLLLREQESSYTVYPISDGVHVYFGMREKPRKNVRVVFDGRCDQGCAATLRTWQTVGQGIDEMNAQRNLLLYCGGSHRHQECLEG